VGDAEIQHQRHRTRRTKGTGPAGSGAFGAGSPHREVGRQLYVPTSLIPAPSHLLRLHFVRCAKEVSDLISCPVVSLLGTRLGGTSAEVVTKSVYLKLLATTSRERHFRK
jgi:hypothetical protein